MSAFQYTFASSAALVVKFLQMQRAGLTVREGKGGWMVKEARRASLLWA